MSWRKRHKKTTGKVVIVKQCYRRSVRTRASRSIFERVVGFIDALLALLYQHHSNTRIGLTFIRHVYSLQQLVKGFFASLGDKICIVLPCLVQTLAHGNNKERALNECHFDASLKGTGQVRKSRVAAVTRLNPYPISASHRIS